MSSPREPSLFDVDPEPWDCARDGHVWTKGVMKWPDEAGTRLVWRCQHCAEWRGRCP